MILSSIPMAAASDVIPSRSSTNSSPPSRATVSCGRTASFNRMLTCLSNASPNSWPRESLTFLNPSRSIRAIANRPFPLPSSAKYSAMRLRIRALLPTPVRGSRKDSSTSRCSLSTHRVTSLPYISRHGLPSSLAWRLRRISSHRLPLMPPAKRTLYHLWQPSRSQPWSSSASRSRCSDETMSSIEDLSRYSRG